MHFILMSNLGMTGMNAPMSILGHSESDWGKSLQLIQYTCCIYWKENNFNFDLCVWFKKKTKKIGNILIYFLIFLPISYFLFVKVQIKENLQEKSKQFT